MTNVTGCQAGYRAEILKCATCMRAPFLSSLCREHTYHEVREIWYPIPWLGLFIDAPITPIVLPVNNR